MPFIHDDFLLASHAARRLYHEFAAAEPILDYHTHLPPDVIARDAPFRDLSELWLAGDHYKWRAMRANGVEESYITGSATPYEKFVAWATTVPHTLRNPLYHWTHLELKRFFDVDILLDGSSANEIWEHVSDQLATSQWTPQSIFARFRVRAICTTDDPATDLPHHRELAPREGTRFSTAATTKMFPTFRPDHALRVDQPAIWKVWVRQLAAVADTPIETLAGLRDALRRRHDDFHALGGRLSDHGLNRGFARACDEQTAAGIFARALAGQAANPTESELFGSYMMLFFGRLDVEKGWTKQLHLGSLRNPNARRFTLLGPDSGFDTIGDEPQGIALAKMLSNMDSAGALPRTILYNINPADNYVFASMIGSFQGDGIAGKMQFGSGWWFLDQKEGMEWQFNALSNLGLISRFIGMLTDSRSFMSFPRHEYFRRVLCNLFGADMERGELPPDFHLIGDLVRRICYENASNYLRLGV